eukprot:scaffold6446_cov104-Isochrysis_galbana.AAC.18
MASTIERRPPVWANPSDVSREPEISSRSSLVAATQFGTGVPGKDMAFRARGERGLPTHCRGELAPDEPWRDRREEKEPSVGSGGGVGTSSGAPRELAGWVAAFAGALVAACEVAVLDRACSAACCTHDAEMPA